MKVLIVRTGAMGDILHALPAVDALGPAQPEWQIGWVMDQHWSTLLIDEQGHSPVVDRLHVASIRRWSVAPFSRATLSEIFALRKLLRAERYDLAVDLQGTLRSAVIARMSGAPVVAGFADPREQMARYLYTRALSRRGAHVVEQNAALLGDATGAALILRGAELPLDTSAEAAVEQLAFRSPIVLLAPTAGWGAKQWPAEHFAELAQRLDAEGYNVLVNAARSNDPGARRIATLSGGVARVLPCNLAELTSVLRRTRLFIGLDSGPTHLAAALDVPLVALFGPTDPARNGPWPEPLRRAPMRVLRSPLSVTSHKRVDTPDPGLASITVDEVLAAISALSL